MLLTVRMVVAEDGTITVTVDGLSYPPPDFAPPWRRSSYPEIVDEISERTGRTLRVDVVEIDGQVISDFGMPRSARSRGEDSTKGATPAAQPEPVAADPGSPVPPRFVELTGVGFVPGEDVAVAIVIAHTDATPDQSARALIDTPHLADSPTGEVILLGRISGTSVLGRPQ